MSIELAILLARVDIACGTHEMQDVSRLLLMDFYDAERNASVLIVYSPRNTATLFIEILTN